MMVLSVRRGLKKWEKAKPVWKRGARKSGSNVRLSVQRARRVGLTGGDEDGVSGRMWQRR
ncbi:hypothetical protein HN873_010821, partial [Arachis hypogaea]